MRVALWLHWHRALILITADNMFTKAPTLPQLVAACPPLLVQHQHQHLPVAPRRPGAMRADHHLLRRHSRTQPQLLLAVGGTPPPPPPVAQVLPVKRPAPAASNESDKGDCGFDDAAAAAGPPSPKLARRCRPSTAAACASPHLQPSIATNPFYRRGSQQQQLEDPPVASATAGHLASTPSRLFAVADVPFPTPLLLSTATPAANQVEKLAAPPASVQRDAQTSPTLPSTPDLRGAGASGGGMSLTSWVRTARCRLAARLRRSLSASRVDVSDVASATFADAPTPKRLQQQVGASGKRKRHASLQRLVQRLTAGSPLSFSGAAAASAAANATTSRTPLASAASLSPSAACGGGVTGRVLQLLPDGSRTVRLQRPRGGKFGFFVARQQDGVHLTRFNDQATQLRYHCVISVGDQILEIEGFPTASMELADMHRFISDKHCLVMRVRSPYGSAW